MALTINAEITGQQITSTFTYCYLFEPLKISILEDDPIGERLFIDLEIIDTADGSVVEILPEYGVQDINPGQRVSIDLMRMARQYHDSNVYKYQGLSDIVDTVNGWKSVVSQYKYKFNIYSDVSTTPVAIGKLPIIGGRSFKDFVATVDQTQSLTEADKFNYDLTEKWLGYPVISQSLADPDAVDSRPTISFTNQTEGCVNNGGMIIYKSRLGGWMTWGLDIAVETESGSYSGAELEVGMFESMDESGGDPYISVNYTGIKSSYGYQLKSIGLEKLELKVVRGVHHSPAIYYMSDVNSSLELMKKGSASTPVSSLANGGDFSLSLNSISNSEQTTR